MPARSSGYRAAPDDTDAEMAPADALRHTNDEVARFPTRAMVILSFVMSVNSYALVSLFPYVGMMVKELLSLQSTNEVGFYAGYVASAFTFGRFLSGYAWGYLTDSIGRKPVILAGLVSVATFSVAFGFSTSYTWAVSSRLILGLTNGAVPALRTSVTEICGPEHVVVGMTYVSSCKAISMVIGTGIGGLLAQPAVHFPGTFSETGLFGRYPFLLPNLVGACCAVLALVVVAVYIPETKGYDASKQQHAASQQPRSDDIGNITGGLAVTGPGDSCTEISQASSPIGNGASLNPSKYKSLTTASAKGRGGYINSSDGECYRGAATKTHDGGHADQDEVAATRVPVTTEEARGHDEEATPGVFGRDGLLATPNVKILLILACNAQALMIGFEEAYPLFALSTPDVGGLGWNTLQIGKVLVVTGLLMTVLQLVFFPPFIKVVGIATWQHLGFLVGIPTFLAVPAVKTLSWNYPSLFAVSVAANTLELCSLGRSTLHWRSGPPLWFRPICGKAGRAVQHGESLGRFLGPAGYAITYAWSISDSGSASAYDWVNHNFVFHASAVVLALCALLAWPTLTAENLMKWEDEDDGSVSRDVSDERSEATAASWSPIDGGDVHVDDSFVSTTAVDTAKRRQEWFKRQSRSRSSYPREHQNPITPTTAVQGAV